MAEPEKDRAEILFASFLESTPPYTYEKIADLVLPTIGPTGTTYPLVLPHISLYCESESCQGLRFFEALPDQRIVLNTDGWRNLFIKYTCRNCRTRLKTYSLAVGRQGNATKGEAMKYGEYPPFGPPTPSRVITLIGPDRDFFLKGRRAENAGFGIGAFAYYRRVVENQKTRIIQEIAKASSKLGASAEMLAELQRASKETQFSKAIGQIKAGIPSALLIDGHNPLTLLHTALSEGLHDHSDEECMELAQEIRLVLTELAERISQALKEEAELSKAVSRLMNRKKPEAAKH